MSKKAAVIISPNWRDYAEKYLKDCLESLSFQTFKNFKVFLADNETNDKSFNFLKKSLEDKDFEYCLVRNKDNDGFAKGNNEAIKIALKENFDYIVLFNMDGALAPDCLQEMIFSAEKDDLAGAIQARIMIFGEDNKINSLGNITHFLGFGYCSSYKEEYLEKKQAIKKEIAYPSGAAVLFKKEVLEKIGLFDEEFWMYNEDQDLGWRLWLAGFKCCLSEKAVFYHKYEFNRSIKKFYWMDRNRLLAIIKNYHFLTLILIFPALIFMEIGLLFFSFLNGSFSQKINVYKYFFKTENWSYFFKAREKAQSLRKVKDRHIVKMFSGRIDYQEIKNPLLSLANIFFEVYWKIIRFFIFW